MTGWPDYTAFAECRGHQFTVVQEQGNLAIQLSKIEPLPPVPERSQPFSLTFSGPLDPVLEQMTYRLAHPHLGELMIFLVPVQRQAGQAGSTHYEAIFN